MKKSVMHLAASALLFFTLSLFNAVLAQHDSGGHTGGHSGGRGGSAGGHDDTTHDHAEGDEGGSEGHGGRGYRGGGRGGHGHSHDVAGDVSDSVENRVLRGRRPVWAQEGIPEVELGRLNVGRAPSFVLARAEDKALEEFTDVMSELYNLTAEQAASLIRENYEGVVRIHSPVQNLAMYRDVMIFGQTQLPGVIPASTFDLAAIFLGSASDKNIPVTEDTIIAINRILGLVEMSEQDVATLAGKAESVRVAILAGHGETETH